MAGPPGVSDDALRVRSQWRREFCPPPGGGWGDLEAHINVKPHAHGMTSNTSSVRQLRVVVEVADFHEALHFYRDVLGMPEHEAFSEAPGARVAILGAGEATLEIVNREQREFIDGVEADGYRSPKVRLALQVEDIVGTTAAVAARGYRVLGEVRHTPFGSRNSRMDGAGGMQLTLFGD